MLMRANRGDATAAVAAATSLPMEVSGLQNIENLPCYKDSSAPLLTTIVSKRFYVRKNPVREGWVFSTCMFCFPSLDVRIRELNLSPRPTRLWEVVVYEVLRHLQRVTACAHSTPQAKSSERPVWCPDTRSSCTPYRYGSPLAGEIPTSASVLNRNWSPSSCF